VKLTSDLCIVPGRRMRGVKLPPPHTSVFIGAEIVKHTESLPLNFTYFTSENKMKNTVRRNTIVYCIKSILHVYFFMQYTIVLYLTVFYIILVYKTDTIG
jgi:hypothetical protein